MKNNKKTGRKPRREKWPNTYPCCPFPPNGHNPFGFHACKSCNSKRYYRPSLFPSETSTVDYRNLLKRITMVVRCLMSAKPLDVIIISVGRMSIFTVYSQVESYLIIHIRIPIALSRILNQFSIVKSNSGS